MIRYGAAWVLPISQAPLRDAWVGVDRGRIVATGRGRGDEDLGDVALLPGLVNAHTHLELSHLRGQIPPATAFVTWIRGVIAARRQRPDPSASEILQGVARGIAESLACGTALVGDISNTLVTFDALARSALAGVVFNEIIRFKADEAVKVVADAVRAIGALTPTDGVRPALAAHATYSVAPLAFREIRRAMDLDGRAPCSVHLSESPEEVEFIASGGGPWRVMLEELGSWDATWTAPGVSPVQFLDESGFLDDRVLAVHGVQMSSADLGRLKARGTMLVTCPRSNRYTGAGSPPIEAFYRSGVPVAIGTDSLASSPDLNVFAELAAMRALAPLVPASVLLDSATRQGARALRFDDEFGSIEAGKRARLIAVAVPRDVGNVEEYLVNGIEPRQIRWLEPQR